MDCYLCQYCKAITNFPWTGSCEQSPTEEHEWISGEVVADQVQMLWERDPDSLTMSSN